MAASSPLRQPRVVAVARDRYLRPTFPFADVTNLPGIAAPKYGQDITFAMHRTPPGNFDEGRTTAVLEPRMRKLVSEFASRDRSGMCERLFAQFLKNQRRVTFFDDLELNRAVLHHENIAHFCRSALSAPHMLDVGGGFRIHQALKVAGWDINRLVAPTDLGVPALNRGLTWARTGDYDNGLGVMVNGIQHAYCIATHYDHDATTQKYRITLRFIFYDVFGLDDDDLREYGAQSGALYKTTAAVGITAWWQLQHQHGYAPLVTRMIVERNFEAPAV